MRTQLPSAPCRTDSTWAFSRAWPRTKHGVGGEGETPRAQQNASTARGAPHNRASSSRPWAAMSSQAAADEERTPAGLPLRTQQQAAQPSGRDPRKHSTSPSKLRAERERSEARAKFSLLLAAGGGGVAVRRPHERVRRSPERRDPLRSHPPLLKARAGRGVRQKGLQ